jgi:hypothetical protein
MKDIDWSRYLEFLALMIAILGSVYTLDSKIERQGMRTDRLYEMYCDSRKASDDRWERTLQEIKELRKEMK